MAFPDNPQQELTSEQKKKVEAYLRDNWNQSPHCPISGHRNWIIGDHIVAPPIHSGAGLLLGGPAYPQVMVICGGCGYTMYFNAVKVGIVSASGEQEGGS